MQTASPHFEFPNSPVASYYRECWTDYRWLWADRASYALHFGYWDSETRSHAESLINTNRLVAERGRIRAGHSALDAGCGVGGTAIWLAQKYAARVMGITICPDQVLCGGALVERRGLADLVTLQIRDFTSTGLPSESFDLVYAIESACYAPAVESFLREASRLLRPGGRVVIIDAFRAKAAFSPEEARLDGSWLSGWVVPDLPTPKTLLDSARRLGFEEILFEDLTDPFRPSCYRLFLLALILYPLASLLRRMRLRTEVQQGNIRAARDHWRALERGLILHGVFSATRS